jgi:DNA replication protein DnaC
VQDCYLRQPKEVDVEVRFSQARFTPALVARLQKHYAALRADVDATQSMALFEVSGLSAEEVERLRLDLEFFDRNPALPLESICAHLSTYLPRNPSQQEMLTYAERLVELHDDSMGAGLYIYGEAGIGKSHVSIGISKQFMKRGLQPNFMVADSYTFDTRVDLTHGQVWVLDDMNSGYGISSRLFKQVVLNIHDRGGRLFVTSNKPYDQLMRELFVGDSEANRMRYEDRTKGMFKILQVDGESHRQEHVWWKDGE